MKYLSITPLIIMIALACAVNPNGAMASGNCTSNYQACVQKQKLCGAAGTFEDARSNCDACVTSCVAAGGECRDNPRLSPRTKTLIKFCAGKQQGLVACDEAHLKWPHSSSKCNTV